jgi:hypothetical protein
VDPDSDLQHCVTTLSQRGHSDRSKGPDHQKGGAGTRRVLTVIVVTAVLIVVILLLLKVRLVLQGLACTRIHVNCLHLVLWILIHLETYCTC